VKRIQAFMQETPDQALAGWEAAVKDIAVKEIFDESPGRATRREERYGNPGVLCGKRDHQYESGVHRVEDAQGIKPIASESGLTPLVGLKGDFRSPR
jgi:hypothetical protein